MITITALAHTSIMSHSYHFTFDCLNHFCPSVSLSVLARMTPFLQLRCSSHPCFIKSKAAFLVPATSSLAHTQSVSDCSAVWLSTPSVIGRLWVNLDDFCRTVIEIWNGVLGVLQVPEKEFWIYLVDPRYESVEYHKIAFKIWGW